MRKYFIIILLTAISLAGNCQSSSKQKLVDLGKKDDNPSPRKKRKTEEQTQPAFKEVEISFFHNFLLDVREDISKTVGQESLTKTVFTYLKNHFDERSPWRQKVPYAKICELLENEEKQLVGSRSEKEQLDREYKAAKSAYDDEDEELAYLRFVALFPDTFSFTLFDDFDVEDAENQYMLQSKHFTAVIKKSANVIAVLQRRKEKMDLKIEKRMTKKNILAILRGYPDPRFDTLKTEGKTRVIALLHEIYNIE